MAASEVLRQYSFLLPKSVGLQIESIARAEGKTMEDLVRRSLKIGLLVLSAQETGQGRLLWEEGGVTRELDVFGKREIAAVAEKAGEGDDAAVL